MPIVDSVLDSRRIEQIVIYLDLVPLFVKVYVN